MYCTEDCGRTLQNHFHSQGHFSWGFLSQYHFLQHLCYRLIPSVAALLQQYLSLRPCSLDPVSFQCHLQLSSVGFRPKQRRCSVTRRAVLFPLRRRTPISTEQFSIIIWLFILFINFSKMYLQWRFAYRASKFCSIVDSCRFLKNKFAKIQASRFSKDSFVKTRFSEETSNEKERNKKTFISFTIHWLVAAIQ